MDLNALFRKMPLSLRLDLWPLAVLLLAPAVAMLLELPWLPGLAYAPLERWAFCLLVYALLSPLSLVGISLLLFWAVRCCCFCLASSALLRAAFCWAFFSCSCASLCAASRRTAISES